VASVYAEARRFTRAVAGLDAAALARLEHMLARILPGLTSQAEAAAARYAALVATGGTSGEAAAFAASRSLAIAQQVVDEVDRILRMVAPDLDVAQIQAMQQGITAARALVEVQLPDGVALGAWQSANIEAVRAAVGMQQAEPMRALFNRLGHEAGRAARDKLNAGLLAGKGPAAVARELRTVADLTRARAETIARTSTLQAFRISSLETYQANGIESFERLAAHSGRTCFAAGVTIDTWRGRVPIEEVRVGDYVLTHTGRYQRVYETLSREYEGEMTRVTASNLAVEATSNHPFLVERQGQLNWVEAGQVRLGDRVFCEPQRLLEIGHHDIGDFTIERRGKYTNDGKAATLQKERFALIPPGDLGVPVGLVNFQGDTGEHEVNRVSPASNDVLLLEGNADGFEADANVALRFRFASKASIAARRTEASIADFAGHSSNGLAARQAVKRLCGAAAGFGAMLPPRAAASKQCAAPLAGNDHHLGEATPIRAESAPLYEETGHVELHTASLARLFNGWVRGDLADFGTEALLTWWAEGQTAVLADAFGPAPLILPHTGARAELARRRRGEHAERCSADGAFLVQTARLDRSIFHSVIVSDVVTRTQYQPIAVYNIEVDGDHSYVAGGMVVHNCAACLALDGSIQKTSELMAVHVQDRCTVVPRVTIPGAVRPQRELGDAWLARQPEDVQRTVLGPGGLKRYQAGTPLSRFASVHEDPDWGPTVRVTPLKELAA
jgi:hypothetical protein